MTAFTAHGAARLAMLALALLRPATAAHDPAYLGINNATGFRTDPDFVDRVIEQNRILGIRLVRMGIDHVGGTHPDDPFRWEDRDRVIGSYLAAGSTIHAAVSPRSHVRCGSGESEWKKTGNAGSAQ